MKKSNSVDEYKDIKCYCCGDRGKKENYVYPIGSKEYENWLNEYIADLENYETDASNVKDHYHDPDRSYYLKNKDFFKDLTNFLIKQEDNCKYINKENKYSYRFEKQDYRKGICVLKDEDELFYLRSDQFGFSAPTSEKRHPYDLYLKTNNKDKHKKVAEWISNTRTIGGSFLWPLPLKIGRKASFHKEYNENRGGKIDSSNRYYMQDRADLALYEVSCFYNRDKKLEEFKRTKISTYIEKYDYAKEWFEHFESFSNYVKFFCFEDFVDEDYNVIDMTQTDKKTPITSDSYQKTKSNPFFKQLQTKEPKEIEETMFNILDTLSKNVIERSKRMLDLK